MDNMILFYRDAGSKCPVDNAPLLETQVCLLH